MQITGANQEKYAKLLRTWAENSVFPAEVFQKIKEEAAKAAQAEKEKTERKRQTQAESGSSTVVHPAE
eukprot:CAMPEP_0174373980 /NCGR_PEP_ID=MMETSP0811_2-20130205/109203_1 /TAXON_ID=73025 ORGANISM="Eutreptiella gymnastica-like, Strain CCMP1594" /NCGR_SAMPLE_ID=MMETSP0811_2 /ASSEMBLY_ACC=CAM_ASM_000667 /LENGTH=67 /DNA_ID=CAMNT_0015522879 /DNA_START=32 /DNA_END=232 /DNA_ORIENTATION=-